MKYILLIPIIIRIFTALLGVKITYVLDSKYVFYAVDRSKLLNNAKYVNSYQISEECNINHIIHHFDKKQPCCRTTICHLA